MPTIWRVIERLKIPAKATTSMTVFMTLLVGGLLTHFIAELQYATWPNPLYFSNSLKWIPHLVLLAAVAGLSSLFQSERSSRRWNIFPLLGAILLYSICRIPLTWLLESVFFVNQPATFSEFVEYLYNHFVF